MPPMPQGPQAAYVEGDMTNVEIRVALRILTHLMMTQAHVVTNHVVAQANLGFGPQSNYSTPTSRIWDFMRMNSPTFHGIKVDDDPQGFIDEVLKMVDVMGVIPREKVELPAYQLKDVA